MNELSIQDSDGTEIIFRKISSDPNVIPVIAEIEIVPTVGKR